MSNILEYFFVNDSSNSVFYNILTVAKGCSRKKKHGGGDAAFHIAICGWPGMISLKFHGGR